MRLHYLAAAMLPDPTGTNRIRPPADMVQQNMMYLSGRLSQLEHEVDLLQAAFLILGFSFVALMTAYLLTRRK